MDERSVAALKRPETWPYPVDRVELVETHISWVFLVGDFAYKFKKPVNYGFLDFSTLEKRHFYCREEVRLNRRLAPQIYLDVIPLSGDPAAPQPGGDGEPFEYAVRMHRFDSDAGFDRLLAAGALTSEHIDEAARVIADFHASAPVIDAAEDWGSARRVTAQVMENFDSIRPLLPTQIDDSATLRLFDRMAAASEAACREDEPLFRERHARGFIRECHGDLHLRNIVAWQDQVLPFDCIEFSESLRWIDTCCELAFLLMDLDDHGRPDFARRLLDAYLQHSGDYDALPLLDFYRAYRAMVRAKVISLRLAQLRETDVALLEEMTRYLELAGSYMQTRRAALMISYGVSGSGKTYAAQRLLEQRDVIRLRSDVERKRLAGLKAQARSDSAPDEQLYDASMNERTYARLLDLAGLLTSRGFVVLVDASFLARKQRDRFRALAAERGLSFAILHFDVSPEIAHARVAARSARADDASEADSAILERQLLRAEPPADEELQTRLRIDNCGEPDLEKVLAFIDSL